MYLLVKPIICPYLVTASPFLIGTSAILWPSLTRALAVKRSAEPLSSVPAGILRAATATLSSGRRWTATWDKAMDAMESLLFYKQSNDSGYHDRGTMPSAVAKLSRKQT